MKILRFLRNLFVFIGWSVVFIVFTNFLIKLVWGFDFLSAHSWNILANFWNQGGVIKTTSDILLVLSLILLPLLWFLGFILAKKLNFWKIFTAPFSFVLKPFAENFSKEPERFVIKNIKSSQQQTEDIKAEISAIKPKKTKEAESIREELSRKRMQNNE